MVGTSPGGLVTYVSEAYAGWTSDRQIIEHSNVLDKCEPGDMILADKDINIEDLVILRHLKLNIRRRTEYRVPLFLRIANAAASVVMLNDISAFLKHTN